MPLADVIQATRQFLFGRASAYRRVFAHDNRDAQLVLRDLARFCRALESTGNADPYVAARLDGRREAFLRIQQHLNMSVEELYRLYGGPQKETPGVTGG